MFKLLINLQKITTENNDNIENKLKFYLNIELFSLRLKCCIIHNTYLYHVTHISLKNLPN